MTFYVLNKNFNRFNRSEDGMNGKTKSRPVVRMELRHYVDLRLCLI